MRTVLKIVLLLVIAVIAMGFFATFNEPGHLWVNAGQFNDCPARPSCVSSVATDEIHRIEPLRYEGEAAAARARLEALLASMPGARIEHTTPEYLHAVFLTPRMKFHDDVELLVQAGGVIQVRSISRFGYRDHGVNRARVEEIRARYSTAG